MNEYEAVRSPGMSWDRVKHWATETPTDEERARISGVVLRPVHPCPSHKE